MWPQWMQVLILVLVLTIGVRVRPMIVSCGVT
ncbi:hypothetical protein X011_00410 [Mycobacterium tuberculosis variant microti OV254]|nr:hypothetical protein X011_00410 [Mycobacterium tuberculosis variant microti OV254]